MSKLQHVLASKCHIRTLAEQNYEDFLEKRVLPSQKVEPAEPLPEKEMQAIDDGEEKQGMEMVWGSGIFPIFLPQHRYLCQRQQLLSVNITRICLNTLSVIWGWQLRNVSELYLCLDIKECPK